MNKEILKQIQDQFDFVPIKIQEYIRKELPDEFYEYINSNIQKPLANFSVISYKRWEKANKKYKVNCLYALPKNIFDQIEKQNQEDFIEVWNKVLKFIWNEISDNSKRNYLFLLVRTHLTEDYGYFYSIDINRLFKVTK